MSKIDEIISKGGKLTFSLKFVNDKGKKKTYKFKTQTLDEKEKWIN